MVRMITPSRFPGAMRRIAATLVVVGVLLGLGLPAAQAGGVTAATPPHERTVTIPRNDFVAFSVDVATTWSLITGITVQSGGAIDIYVTEQAGYNQYTNPSAPSFSYLVAYTQERVTTYNKTITDSGLKFIILDNDIVTQNGATPTDNVTAKIYFGQSSGSFILGMVVLIIVVLALVAMVVIRRRRRKAAAIPPPMPMTPPMPPPT